MLHRSFAVLLLAAAALVLPAPAQAAACSGSSGVTVLVQFPDHTEVGCAAGDPVSGYQALSKAGFSLTFATGNGTGAICSINSYPDHACPSMPPQSAYWAYFHAKPGGSWSYSSTGGGSYNPKPGTVEGWRFGGGSAPTSAPPGTASTPTPKPTSTPSRPVSHPTSGASNPVVKPDSTGHASSGSTPTAPDATASTSGRPTDPEATATGGPTAQATDDVAAPDQATDAADSVENKAVRDGGSGGNRSWVWGVVLVVLLGGAAAAKSVSRRKA
ncbi:hypothetical protein [Nocardioides marmorisolisilvae]|uniref:hypothetical protein n=1 Tax=Nocardioides marmorisolisilvae TaxID=1542737 RepID=UPI00161B60BB|nr:hypothetical protein [Nocardioides marmorisolisilvae]